MLKLEELDKLSWDNLLKYLKEEKIADLNIKIGGNLNYNINRQTSFYLEDKKSARTFGMDAITFYIYPDSSCCGIKILGGLTISYDIGSRELTDYLLIRFIRQVLTSVKEQNTSGVILHSNVNIIESIAHDKEEAEADEDFDEDDYVDVEDYGFDYQSILAKMPEFKIINTFYNENSGNFVDLYSINLTAIDYIKP